MKKNLALILSIVLIFSCAMPSLASGDIKVNIDGKKINFDVQPTVINGRTLVPVRAIFEALGASVRWVDNINAVNAQKGDTYVTLYLGNTSMYVNSVEKKLDVPAMEIDGRTMVPIRAISEAFGATITWNEAKNTVEIKSDSAFYRLVDYIKENSIDISQKGYARYETKIGGTTLYYLNNTNYVTMSNNALSPFSLKVDIYQDTNLNPCYELSGGAGYTVMTGSIDPATFTHDTTKLRYKQNVEQNEDYPAFAAYILHAILEDINAHVPSVPLEIMGFVNHNGHNIMKIPVNGSLVTYKESKYGDSRRFVIASTKCIRGAKANKIMESVETNKKAGIYKEWVILDLYIEYYSSSKGANDYFYFDSFIKNNLYGKESGKLSYYSDSGELPSGYTEPQTAKFYPGEGTEFTIALLVNKDEEIYLDVYDDASQTRHRSVVLDGSHKVETKNVAKKEEVYSRTDVPTYTEITGVPLEEYSYGYYQYKYTKKSDLLKYHKELINRGYTVDKEDGEDVTFKSKSKERVSISIHDLSKGKEIWIDIYNL